MNILAILTFFISSLLFFSAIWAVKYFGLSCFEQIIFHLKVPLEGTNSDVIKDWFKMCFSKGLLLTIAFAIVTKYPHTLFIASVLLLIGAAIYVGLFGWIINRFRATSLYEDYFVDAKDVNITFPDKKRNLIYIFMESMENTYTSKENGGDYDQDLIPYLSKLNKEHTSFSHTEKMGGAHVVAGTGWTTGGIVAQTSGLGLTIPLSTPNFTSTSDCLSQLYTLGDILEKEGYNQEFCIGSKAEFGGRECYLRNHGHFKIFDTETAKEKLPENYHVFWGYEDKKLFEFAKEEVTKLSQQEKPFHFMMLTVDTHHPYGYKDTDVEDRYPERLSNIIFHSQAQVQDFIEWCKTQPFYQDTTIVLCGDHTSMAAEYIDKTYDTSFDRTTYNTIIHAMKQPKHTKHRLFTSMDMFPTVLSSLGVDIEGNQLGFGIDLFSDEKTIPEKIGIQTFDRELRKKSKYWEKII